MSWGVATQNGVSVSLASIVSLSCGATEAFSPLSLFTSGVQGAWYDPSDYNTLFQDSAGTTPVTAVEQPVGLMLDKSQGLVLGSEVTTNGGFATDTDWTKGAGVTISGGTMNFSAATSNTFQREATEDSSGKVYEYTIVVSSVSGGNLVAGINSSPPGSADFPAITAAGTYTYRRRYAGTTAYFYIVATGFTGSIDSVSCKAVLGNHASQATSASRPVLRARYNLLTYSEQFDNAAWTKSFVTLSANAAVAPDGTTTADLIYPITGTYRGVYQRPTLASGIFVTTIYAKAAGKSWVAFVDFAGGQNRAWANVSTGAVGTVNAGYSLTITAAQNGWYRLDFTQTAAASNPYLWISICDADNTNTGTTNGTDGIYVWGADLRTGSSAGTYQRIAAATDYDTVGFAPYLAFDGVDDFLSAAYVQSAYPLTITAGVNNDTSSTSATGIVSVAVSDASYKQLRDDTLSQTAAMDRNATQLVSPIITALGNKFCLAQLETSLITHQVNGGTAQTIANTNAFGTSVSIFVGKTRPAGLFSAAKDYGVVITNTVLTAAEKDSLKNYMGGKMGVTL
jgi:hypothetical protein